MPAKYINKRTNPVKGKIRPHSEARSEKQTIQRNACAQNAVSYIIVL